MGQSCLHACLPASLSANFYELEDEEMVVVATALAEALKISKVKSVKYVTCNKLLDFRSSHCMDPHMDPGPTSPRAQGTNSDH